MIKILEAIPKRTLDELKKYISQFDKWELLQCLAKICFEKHKYDEQDSRNFIQAIPQITNTILIYANGKASIARKEFEELIQEIISHNSHEINISEGATEEEYDNEILTHYFIKTTKCDDEFKNATARLLFIFDFIKSHDENLSFENITGFDLNKILVFFNFYPRLLCECDAEQAFNLTMKAMKLTETEIELFIKIMENNFVIKLEDAQIQIEEHCKKKNTWTEDLFVFLENKPFVEREGKTFLGISPNHINNAITSSIISFYIKCNQRKKEKTYGNVIGDAYERYVIKILMNQIKGYEKEPKYYSKPKDKGPDIVRIKKNKIPFYMEITKTVFFKTVENDFSAEKYKDFLKEKIIPKFRQIFKWMEDHKFKYKGIDLLAEARRSQFIVCIAKKPHCLNTIDTRFKELMEQVQKAWIDISKQTIKLKAKSIYLIDIYELELITSVAKFKNKQIESILFDFKKYLRKTPSITRKLDGISIRLDLVNWLYQEYFDSNMSNGNPLEHPLLKEKFMKFIYSVG